MMLRRLAWISALLFASAALSTAADELVIFKDYRALIVQSHRVEGDWTYLRIGSGEMAVPSATILKFDQEQGVSAAARASDSAPPSRMMPPSQPGQSAESSQPFRHDVPNRVRPLPPTRQPQENFDDEDKEDAEDKAGAVDEEAETEAPAGSVPAPPPMIPGKVPTFNPNIPQGAQPQTPQPIDQRR